MACVLIVNTVMFIIAIRIAKKSIQKRGEDNEKTFALIKGKLLIIDYRYIYLIEKNFFFPQVPFHCSVFLALLGYLDSCIGMMDWKHLLYYLRY